MKISALPKIEFDKMMLSIGITDDNVEEFKNMYLISISHSTVDDLDDEMACKEEWIPHFSTGHKNVLRLKFDDVLENAIHTNLTPKFLKNVKQNSTYASKAFDEEMAQQVLEFVKQIPNVSETKVIVHCAMGKSRSTAIAEFVAKFNGLNPDSIYTSKLKSPNKLVEKLLKNLII